MKGKSDYFNLNNSAWANSDLQIRESIPKKIPAYPFLTILGLKYSISSGQFFKVINLLYPLHCYIPDNLIIMPSY